MYNIQSNKTNSAEKWNEISTQKNVELKLAALLMDFN